MSSPVARRPSPEGAPAAGDARPLVLLHAAAAGAETLRRTLAEAPYALRVATAAADLEEDLAREDVAVIVAWHDLVPAAVTAIAGHVGGGPGRASPAVLAVGCSDGRAVDAALAAGARLAARADAGARELVAKVEMLVTVRELTRTRRLLEDDLRRHGVLVLKDDLTAAHNRRFFDRCLDEEIERARRFANPMSLIFMDIDNLKDVNNRHGHAMGSLVLKEAAARIIRCIRSIDKVVRYGGDEFCIILPETGTEGALEVAERIRQDFSQQPFALEPTGGVTLTASFGIASFPEHGRTKGDLVAAADHAMLAIKEMRKNGVQVAPLPPAGPGPAPDSGVGADSAAPATGVGASSAAATAPTARAEAVPPPAVGPTAPSPAGAKRPS